MVLILKDGATKEEIETIEKKLYKETSKSGFNAKKYNGIIKLKDDPLEIQKRLRNECERILLI